MVNRLSLVCLVAAVYLCFCGREAKGQEDVADVPSESLTAGGDISKRYFLIGSYEGSLVPDAGFGLLIVLPGGDGSADFNPFVKRIYKKALSWKYLVAELVAVKWAPEQRIVWPTSKNRVQNQEFSTEEFIEAVIEDIRGKCKLDENHIFSLSWSSGGPAGYAYSLQENRQVTGSFIAMSVFKPDTLPPLEQAKDHAYVLFHSQLDKVCPFRMAEEAEKRLTANGAKVRISKYAGGHGWPRDPYSRIRFGIRWLEKNHAEPPERSEEVVGDVNMPAEGTPPEEPNETEEPHETEQPHETEEPNETEQPRETEGAVDTGWLFPVTQGGKWGYINNKGQFVIKPQFDMASEFSEGMAGVSFEGKTGYIDKTGQIKFYVESSLGGMSAFSEGLAAVCASDTRTIIHKVKWGYIDKTGQLVIAARYSSAGRFSDGRALVTMADYHGYIDKTGKMVIPNTLSVGQRFSEGLAFVQGQDAGGRCGYMDPNGSYGVEPRLGEGRPFSEGLAAVRKRALQGNWGYIDKTGKFVIEPRYNDAGSFSEGLAAVKLGANPYGTGGNWGFIDKAGKMVIEPKFRKAGSFSDGLAVVSNGLQYGYIDRTGRRVIEYQFEQAEGFKHGLARARVGMVSRGGKFGYIDKTGSFVWEFGQ